MDESTGKEALRQNEHGSETEIIEPKDYDEVTHIAGKLAEGKAIILNVKSLDRDLSQRIIDFVTGATEYVCGSHHRIGDGVFLFIPPSKLAGA